MRKLISTLICCSFLVTSGAVVAYADDKFNYSVEYRVWAISEKDRDYDSDADDDRDYFSQLLRVCLGYSLNEYVSVHTRMDYSEGVWGQDFNDWYGWASTKEDNEIGVDRVYVDLKRSIFSATIGQHWSGSANYILWDSQTTGATVAINTPVAMTLHYSKMDEGDNVIDDIGKDIDFYAANIDYSSDAFGVNVTFATRQDDSDADESPWAVGLQATAKLGFLGLNAEVDQFGGSKGEMDVVGTQAFLDAKITQSNALSYGLRVLWANGTDDTENEVQYNQINAGAETFSPFGTEGAMIWWPYPQGYAIRYKGFFDPAGASAGVLAFNPYISYMAANGITLYAKIAHLTVQEQDNTNLDSQLIGLAQVDWALPWFPGTTLSAAYIYDQPSYDDDTADDAHSSMIGQLKVAF